MSAPDPILEPIHLQAFTEIGIIHQLAIARLEQILPAEMSAAQFGVLTHFMRRGGQATPAALASAFQVTRGAMTNTLQRLEAQGLIKVVPDAKDGRSKQVSLTPEGHAAYVDIAQRLGPRNAALLAAFSEADMLAILPTLRRLRMWLDENR